MRLFNVDLHISVIADLKRIFSAFGHTIDDKCLSGHADIVGRKQDYIEELSRDKWTWLIYNWEFEKFYKNHKSTLDRYDGFVVTYPPVFSMLYEKTGKPIIVQIPIRYDHGMHGRPDLMEKYRLAMGSRNCFFSANNLLDKKYFEMFTGIQCRHIPSFCDYTGMKYRNGEGPALVYSPEEKTAAAIGGAWRPNLKRGYRWKELERFRAAVHFPYQISTMSIFEHYTANIPMLFPSKKFLKEMYFGGWPGILHQVSNFLLHGNKPGSLAHFTGNIDPNDYRNHGTVDWWIDNADFYDESWMPGILYFDTIDEAKNILDDLPKLRETSSRMEKFNVMRKERIHAGWKEVFDGIQIKG